MGAVVTSAPAGEPPDFLTTAEVAALLRVSKPHVVHLVQRQSLPGIRLGRSWRFARLDVLAWIEAQKKGDSNGRSAA